VLYKETRWNFAVTVKVKVESSFLAVIAVSAVFACRTVSCWVLAAWILVENEPIRECLLDRREIGDVVRPDLVGEDIDQVCRYLNVVRFQL
jgi:hypothetical protein